MSIHETAQKIRDNTHSILAEYFPAGVVVSGEFCLGSVMGEPGRSLKFNLSTHRWCDFANPENKGGDVISLYAARFNLDKRDAFWELAEKIGQPFQPKTLKKAKYMKRNDGKLGWIPTFAPWQTKLPDFEHPLLGRPTDIYPYYAPEGRYGFICRYDTPEGKEIRPIVFARDPMNENRHEWRWQQMAEPRPLYNLLRIREVPSDFAIVVEGEKAANALSEVLWPVCTWSGGSCAWRKTDFSPIFGRHVILWPDADEPGIKCMQEIGNYLRQMGTKTFTLNVSDLGEGEDAADLNKPLEFLVDRLPTNLLLMVKDDLANHESTRSI